MIDKKWSGNGIVELVAAVGSSAVEAGWGFAAKIERGGGRHRAHKRIEHEFQISFLFGSHFFVLLLHVNFGFLI
jgi:hypothetical protein